MIKLPKKLIEQTKKDQDILALAIFGSSIKEEKYKDIDICIFLKPKKYSHLQLSKKKLQYSQENEIYDIQIFQQLPIYIQKEIFTNMELIFCKDEDLLYDLNFEFIRELEHFEPFYETYLEAVANG
tara:strand:+ start:253 stop:630 length:378 start_codon:yes stop_codon:yes gene_type:complete